MDYKKYVMRVTSRGRAYHYYRPSKELRAAGAKLIRLPDGENPYAAAARIHQNGGGLDTGRLRKHVQIMLNNARRGARLRDLSVALTVSWIAEQMERQNWRCAVSGVPFDLEGNSNDACRRPWRPSLDRVDTRKGYTADNVRIVCTITNYAMGEWGEDALIRLARAIVAKRGARGAVANRPNAVCKPLR